MEIYFAIVAILAYTVSGIVFAHAVGLFVGPPEYGREDEHQVFLIFAGILWPLVLTVIVVDFFVRLLGNVFRGR